MCAGRATHQPTSNGGENIACRNKSLIRGVSNAVCSKNKSPLAPRDGSGGRPYAQARAAPALRRISSFSWLSQLGIRTDQAIYQSSINVSRKYARAKARGEKERDLVISVEIT
ncbi:putative NADH-ubiquinone oxidoreductase chain [Cucumis melo var. makuwa]|uniref:Putative NADH-ubiquinone oxidoreductase chain n=1 Tax=Cucumis melo var. makuwa TaxID=1194695 RepID=A0A5D3CFD9_CUCMM|nr:putative NADH-ubiquinone oxidoreductase chain [Cucumis melo var. makuwa]